MKKGTKIFIIVFILEIALLIFGSFSMRETCNYPTPCSVPTFFNPLGIQLGVCIQVLAQAPCNIGLVYQAIWLIIFTSIAYIIYFIKSKKSKQNGK